jgi:hypothetical protein
MARAVIAVRAAPGLWASARGDDWEQSRLPFLRHLLAPTLFIYLFI